MFYVICFLLCISCAGTIIKYDCETHSIYSEEGYDLSSITIVDSNYNRCYFYKKRGKKTDKVNIYNLYDYFYITDVINDSIKIVPNMKYVITNHSSPDATRHSIILYTDSAGNIICPY